MSQRALLLAVKSRLQTALSLDDTVCDIAFGAQPPPIMGEEFISIWPGDWRGNDIDNGLDEYYSVNVTVTRRLPYAPMDRWGTEVLVKLSAGLDARVEAIRYRVHMNYSILNAANATIGVTENGFVEPLRFRTGGRPELKFPDWFSAESADGGGAGMNAGVAQTLTFVDARRVQSNIDIATVVSDGGIVDGFFGGVFG